MASDSSDLWVARRKLLRKNCFESYAKQWLDQRFDLAIRTKELYEYLLESHINPMLGGSSLQDLTPSMVRSWHAELAQRHPSTAAKSYRLLSSIMTTAVTDGIITNSPCRVRGAGIEHAEERPVATVEEVKALADAMPDRLRLVVLLATWCQLRRGEILGLRRKDVDPLRSMIHIERSRTFSRNGTSITKSPKSRAGRRSLAVSGPVMEAIAEHLKSFVNSAPDSLLFCSPHGAPLSVGVLQRAWTKARLKVGRPDLHLHDLRHTGLTFAAATGATTAELMRRAGHASTEAALRYQHATRDRDRILAKALEDLMESSG
jgi:integrase